MEELSLTHSAIERTISNLSRKASNIGSEKTGADISHKPSNLGTEQHVANDGGEEYEKRSSIDQPSTNDGIEKAETHRDNQSKKEDLSRIESEVVYPTGPAVALIMLSLYLAIFLIALVSQLPFLLKINQPPRLL